MRFYSDITWGKFASLFTKSISFGFVRSIEKPLKSGRFILLMCFILVESASFGQQKKLIFQSIQQGLSHQIIHTIIKDSKGFVWFGTHDGLNKYTGTKFIIYENDPADSSSLIHNSIHAMIEDRNKNLWIGTSQGLNLYNPEKDNFINVDRIKENVNHLNTSYVSALCEDIDGNIWIGTFGYGINVYNYKQHKFNYHTYYAPNKFSVNSQYITALVRDNQGNIWVGTYTGLDMYDWQTKQFRHFVFNANDATSLSYDHVTALFKDKSGDIWVGTQRGGINKVVRKDGKVSFKRYMHSDVPGSLSDNYVWSICQDKKGNIWVGTDKGGLNCLDLATDKISSYQAEEGETNSLSSNSIWSLFYDDNEILWIGTYNKGINVMDPKYQKFEQYQRNWLAKNTLPNNDVRSFSQDKQGNVWIATDGGGICLFNLKTRQFVRTVMNEPGKTLITKNNVMQVLCDSHENIWIGMWGGGVDRLDKNARKIKNYKIEGVQGAGDNNVITIYESKQGHIWVGTAASGLYLYNAAKDKFEIILDKNDPLELLNTAFVVAVFEDDNQDLWLGTLYGLVHGRRIGNGTYSFKRFFHNDKPGSISSNRIITIFEDSRKNLWFGTEDMGLNLFNKRDSTFTVFQKRDGLPNNAIKAILEDHHGDLWMSTNKGLCEFSPTTKKIRVFTQEDGLNSDEFYKSCFKTSKGEFFFGGNKGFNIFYPDSIKMNSFIPPVYLTDFKLFNKSVKVGEKGSPLDKQINETKKIRLTYKQSSFTIEFAALNYTRASRNQYKYILEGLDQDWNYVGSRQSATYTSINAGTYIFKVMGSNNDGVFNTTPTTLEITVLPPYWQTKVAYVIYILIFFGLLYVFIKLQMIRVKQLQILRIERMKRQKEEEVNKIKMQFFTNISHEFRTPLSLILSPLENIISSGSIQNGHKQQLTKVYKNADHLYRLINELMDFTKAEDGKLKLSVQQADFVGFCRDITSYYSDIAMNRNIDFQFITSEDRVDAWFDRDKIEKVLLNLLTNAFKYTADKGKIALQLEKVQVNNLIDNKVVLLDKIASNEYLKLSVIDNGIGIPQEFIDKIFDRFFQVPEKYKNNQTGTGIGLSLTRSLVELHHGKISVTSEMNKETVFTILLPLGKSHFGPDEMIDLPSNIARQSIALTNKYSNEGASNGKKEAENAPVILLVEDNHELRDYVSSILSGTYKVLEAANGKTGLELAIEHVPDLIISDVIMPEMTGIELCKNVKEEVRTSHIPFVMLTAKSAVENKIEGIEIGADAYITKPFNVKMLEVTLKNLIETRQKLFQRFSQEVYIMPKEISDNPLDQNFLERTIGYVDENIADESLSVENLASYLCMSRSQAYRKIKALTGQTATEFIRTVRLKMAVKLMESGELNVSEIAFKVGFSSPAYFTKCFKEQFNKLPSEYLPDSNKKKKVD